MQIKYTANQDFGTNPISDIIPQSQRKQNTFISKIKQKLQKNKESLENNHKDINQEALEYSKNQTNNTNDVNKLDSPSSSSNLIKRRQK